MSYNARNGKHKIPTSCQPVQDLQNLSDFVNAGPVNNSACSLHSMESVVQSSDILYHAPHVRLKPAGFTMNFAHTNSIQKPFVNKTHLSSDTQSVKFPVLHASDKEFIWKFFTNSLKFCKDSRLLVFDPRNYRVRLYVFLRIFRFHVYAISASCLNYNKEVNNMYTEPVLILTLITPLLCWSSELMRCQTYQLTLKCLNVTKLIFHLFNDFYLSSLKTGIYLY